MRACEEELLVELLDLALDAGGQQVGGHAAQDAVVAGGVLGQGSDQLLREQARVAGLGAGVGEELRQLGGRGGLQYQTGADATAERDQVLGGEAFGQAGVAAEDGGEQAARIEVRAGQDAQLAEHLGAHLLRLVDQQHWAHQGRLDVGLPLLAQRLEAAPAVAERQRYAEEVAELAVEVGDAALRVADHADGDVAQTGEPLGQDAQGDRLAGAGRAGDEGEAALAHLALYAEAEVLDARRDVECLRRQLGQEGIPLEAEEGL